MKQTFIFVSLAIILLGCGFGNLAAVRSKPTATPTVIVAKFTLPTPSPTALLTSTPTVKPTETPTPPPTHTSLPVPSTPTSDVMISKPEPSPTSIDTPLSALPTDNPLSEPPPSDPAPTPSSVDFVLRYVRLRSNEENSWDGTLGPGQCGSDHSIYVHVADAQENLLDGVLIGDKYGNFEVPTGVDGPGVVRILVWSATMELAVMGHQDGTPYTSEFTPPLSTLDEHIPLEWLKEAGYCESLEDCQWRVENNQLCRGHYSYDVIFQRTW